MVSHQCGFFHVSLNHLLDWISCHTLNSWMVSHQRGFFHVSSNYLTWSICSRTLNRWMVSHQYGFFHESSNYLMSCICSHIESNGMVSHHCGSFHESLTCLLRWKLCHTQSNWVVSWKWWTHFSSSLNYLCHRWIHSSRCGPSPKHFESPLYSELFRRPLLNYNCAVTKLLFFVKKWMERFVFKTKTNEKGH